MEREVPAGQFWGLPPGQAVQDPPPGQTVWGPPWVRVSRVLTESSVSAAPDDPAHPAPLWSSLSSIQIIPVGNNALSPHQKQLFYFWLTLFWANPLESSCLKGNCSQQIRFFLCAAVVIQSISPFIDGRIYCLTFFPSIYCGSVLFS